MPGKAHGAAVWQDEPSPALRAGTWPPDTNVPGGRLSSATSKTAQMGLGRNEEKAEAMTEMT